MVPKSMMCSFCAPKSIRACLYAISDIFMSDTTMPRSRDLAILVQTITTVVLYLFAHAHRVIIQRGYSTSGICFKGSVYADMYTVDSPNSGHLGT